MLLVKGLAGLVSYAITAISRLFPQRVSTSTPYLFSGNTIMKYDERSGHHFEALKP